MRKSNGVPREHFNLFLKEYEWRFNIGSPKSIDGPQKHSQRTLLGVSPISNSQLSTTIL